MALDAAGAIVIVADETNVETFEQGCGLIFPATSGQKVEMIACLASTAPMRTSACLVGVTPSNLEGMTLVSHSVPHPPEVRRSLIATTFADTHDSQALCVICHIARRCCCHSQRQTTLD
jgi:hypothetical protein